MISFISQHLFFLGLIDGHKICDSRKSATDEVLELLVESISLKDDTVLTLAVKGLHTVLLSHPAICAVSG